MASHNELGKLGEEEAAAFLERNGYEILERNWISGKAEVDIIAQKENVIAVVEVKTRSTDEFGLPQEFVKPRKIRLLVEAIDAFISARGLEAEVRFDIIAVVLRGPHPEIEHLPDAFFHF